VVNSKVKDPWIVDNFFKQSDYTSIINKINTFNFNQEWLWSNDNMNRWFHNSPYITNILITNIDKARKDFGSETLLPTYATVALYENDKSSLPFHYDSNACTYSYDVCLYSKEPWPVTIEGKDYVLKANQAIAMYGEDQFHGRPPFTPGNKVLMLFLHYAEPDHWYFNYKEKTR
jgi:hypothetical protein